MLVLRWLATWALIFGLTLPATAAQETFKRLDGESAQDFARRATGAPADDIHVLETRWNGQAVIFADYSVFMTDRKTRYQEEIRRLVLLARTENGAWRRAAVTDGEEEGDAATIEAIGFANADKDPATELIVLLSWRQNHHTIVEGMMYEVRIFDDLRSNASTLTYLKSVSKHFDVHACDCYWPEEKRSEHFPFKTIMAIKRELKKMGF